MANIWNALLFNPLLNILIFLYQTVAFHDFGLAVIFLTVLIRLILFPVFQKSARHQKVMQELQPKLKKIQEEHKNDRAKKAEAMMALYKDHQINPLSGFLLLLIQLPILIALYQVFSKSLTPESLVGLYSFIPPPSSLDYSFLGLINLANRNIFIIGLAAIAQYFQAKLSLRKIEPGQKLTQVERMSRQMAFLGPILTVVVLSQFPSALGLFWLVTSLFSIIQQVIINRQLTTDGKLGNIRKTNS